MDPRLRAVLFDDPRYHCRVQHRGHFVRHAGKPDELPVATEVDAKTWRGTDRIGNDRRPLWKARLFQIVGGKTHAALFETGFEHGGDCFNLFRSSTEELLDKFQPYIHCSLYGTIS